MYKYYSSISSIGDIWAVTINSFWLMIKDLEILNEKFLEADVFLKWLIILIKFKLKFRFIIYNILFKL